MRKVQEEESKKNLWSLWTLSIKRMLWGSRFPPFDWSCLCMCKFRSMHFQYLSIATYRSEVFGFWQVNIDLFHCSECPVYDKDFCGGCIFTDMVRETTLNDDIIIERSSSESAVKKWIVPSAKMRVGFVIWFCSNRSTSLLQSRKPSEMTMSSPYWVRGLLKKLKKLS